MSRPKLTEEQEARVTELLCEQFGFICDEIAEDLGLPSRIERDWTEAEMALIEEEQKRRSEPFFIRVALDPEIP